MSLPVAEVGFPKNLAASAAFSPGPCQLIGFYVNNTNAGTLIIKDGGTGGTAISGTITPAIGWHAFPVNIGTSGFATIGGSALDVTFFFALGH